MISASDSSCRSPKILKATSRLPLLYERFGGLGPVRFRNYRDDSFFENELRIHAPMYPCLHRKGSCIARLTDPNAVKQDQNDSLKGHRIHNPTRAEADPRTARARSPDPTDTALPVRAP